MKVYLSGAIYKKDKRATDVWRNIATELLQAKGFGILNPCRDRLVYDAAQFTPQEIVARDHCDILRADIILVNGNPERDHLSWGTAMEIERAHTLGKPIVMFSTDDRTRKHPWCQAYCARIFSSLGDAVDYIVQYWKD